MRKIAGKWLDLYTDIPATAAIEELPGVFDQAISQWCTYFQIDEQTIKDWRVIGSLMKDKQRFEQAGLLPDSLPVFSARIQWGIPYLA